MRTLNDLEKKVLKVLVSNHHYSDQGLVQMATVVDHFLGPKHGISVMVNLDDNQVAMSIPENDIEMLRSKFLTVITVFNILKYLTDEGLIVIVGEPQNRIALGNQYKEGQTSFIPDPISKYIADNLTKYVLVTEELKNIVLSNYRDAEHIRHQQTVYISVAALIVSILLGLYGVYNGLSTDKALDKRFEQLIDNGNKNTNKIESVINSFQADTIDYMPPLKEAVTTLERISIGVAKLNEKALMVTTKQAISSDEHKKAN